MQVEFDVRAMQPDDIEAAGTIIYGALARAHRAAGLLEPVADAGQGGAIARRYLDSEPEGCLVADRNGQVAAVGFVHVRGAVGSIGPVAVEPRAQAQGLGKRLASRLIEKAEAAGCEVVRALIDTISPRAIGIAIAHGLAATDAGLQMAALGGLRGPGRFLAGDGEATRALDSTEVERVTAYDADGFGGSRRRDFEAWLAGGEGLVIEEAGVLRGYLFGRVEDNLGILGPGAADSPAAMATLMASLGGMLGGRAHIIRTCVVASQQELVHHALRMGFRVTSTSLYLMKGGANPYSQPRVIGWPADVV